MRYHVTFDAPTGGAAHAGEPSLAGGHAVDVVERPDGTLDVRVDGRPVDLDVVSVGGQLTVRQLTVRQLSVRQLSVRVDGQVVDLTTDGTPPDWNVVASGDRASVHVESERTRSGARGGRGEVARGAGAVKSPMPGRVVKVLCAAGDVVEAGQALLVLEAMKMENEVRARAPGVVAQVHVAAGTAVERNATLVTFVSVAPIVSAP